jgi:hypothetical protein
VRGGARVCVCVCVCACSCWFQTTHTSQLLFDFAPVTKSYTKTPGKNTHRMFDTRVQLQKSQASKSMIEVDYQETVVRAPQPPAGLWQKSAPSGGPTVQLGETPVH